MGHTAPAFDTRPQGPPHQEDLQRQRVGAMYWRALCKALCDRRAAGSCPARSGLLLPPPFGAQARGALVPGLGEAASSVSPSSGQVASTHGAGGRSGDSAGGLFQSLQLVPPPGCSPTTACGLFLYDFCITSDFLFFEGCFIKGRGHKRVGRRRKPRHNRNTAYDPGSQALPKGLRPGSAGADGVREKRCDDSDVTRKVAAVSCP